MQAGTSLLSRMNSNVAVMWRFPSPNRSSSF